MLKLLLLAFGLAAYGCAQVPDCIAHDCSFGTNFAADLKGAPDARPGTWGSAEAILKPITFSPPPGYRVRVKRVYGDWLIWPVGKVEPGQFAGTLLGLQTTAPEGSTKADWAGDNAMLYVQHATGGGVERAPFDFVVKAGGLLQPDHKLIVKMAVWLNNTGLQIHMEPSFVVVYRFER